MFLVPEDGTASSFRGLRETVEKRGLFRALHIDRGSHYFHRYRQPVIRCGFDQSGAYGRLFVGVNRGVSFRRDSLASRNARARLAI